MKIVILGSACFEGFEIAKRLLDLNNKVYGIDDLITEYEHDLKIERNNILLKYKNFEFIKLPKENKGIESLFRGDTVDYVMDLDSRDYYYQFDKNWRYSPYTETNVLGTTKVFELAVELKAKKFIYGSKHSIYGITKKELLTEKKIIPKPISPVGSSKLAGEKVVEFMSQHYNMPTVVFRFFSSYGPYMDPHKLIYRFIEKIHHGERELIMHTPTSTTRDFIYSTDLVNFVTASLDKRLKFQIFNIASGISYSMEDLADVIAEEMGVKEKIKVVMHRKDFTKLVVKKQEADISKAVQMLNYIPQVDLHTGIRNTVKWYLETQKHKDRFHVG